MRLLIFIFLLAVISVDAQRNWSDEIFYKDCRKGEEKWSSFDFKGQKYQFSLIKKSYEGSYNQTNYFTGTVLLKLSDNKPDHHTLLAVLSIISLKIKLRKFMVFKTCEASRIYISATGAKNSKEKIHLYLNTVGHYDNGKLK